MQAKGHSGTFEVEGSPPGPSVEPRVETIWSDKTFQQLFSGFSKARLITYVGGPGEILDLFERDRFGSVDLIISENFNEVKGNTITVNSAATFRQWLPLAGAVALSSGAAPPPGPSKPTLGERFKRLIGR